MAPAVREDGDDAAGVISLLLLLSRLLLLSPLPLTCDLKRAEHRSWEGVEEPRVFECRAAARVCAAAPFQRGAQGTAAQRRRVSGANGFGYFCQDKSNPLLQERKLLLLLSFIG